MAPDAFELSRFAPPTGVTVKFRSGQSFRFPGDPDVDDVAIMLRLEGQIQSPSGADLAETILEGKDTLRRLILDADPTQDVSNFKVGTEEMLVIFALLVHGASVAEAVGTAITAYNTQSGETPAEGAAEALDDDVAEERGDPGPLSPSTSSSSERSSGSDADAPSLLATG